MRAIPIRVMTFSVNSDHAIDSKTLASTGPNLPNMESKMFILVTFLRLVL